MKNKLMDYTDKILPTRPSLGSLPPLIEVLVFDLFSVEFTLIRLLLE